MYDMSNKLFHVCSNQIFTPTFIQSQPEDEEYGVRRYTYVDDDDDKELFRAVYV